LDANFAKGFRYSRPSFPSRNFSTVYFNAFTVKSAKNAGFSWVFFAGFAVKSEHLYGSKRVIRVERIHTQPTCGELYKKIFYGRVNAKFHAWRGQTRMNVDRIPDIIIGRLPIYLRALQRLADKGVQTTSSQELGEIIGISAAQIRKDISQFGEFGKQGTGYSIPFLIERLQDILKVNRVWDVIIVGMGDIGHALARYNGFINRGFRVSMLFDNDPAKIGQRVGEFEIQSTAVMAEKIKQHKIRIAMLTVPAAAAQEIADQLVKAGVKAILNYAPITLNVPKDVRVQYIDPATHLQRMTYYL
jgi:redox-sensing transcriptional repressor